MRTRGRMGACASCSSHSSIRGLTIPISAPLSMISRRSCWRAGGRKRYLELARDTLTRARRFQPDVVYAHFLVPTGLIAALASRAPLVATAHGRDVRNVDAIPGVRAATRYVARRAAALIAGSDYLRRELEAKVPEAR